MKKIVWSLVLIVGLILVLGSAGNLREYYGGRNVIVYIADNNSSYVAFECSNIIHQLQSGESSEIMTLTNNLGKDATFYLYSENDMLTFSNPTYLVDRESKVIEAEYNGGYGEYIIPVKIYAEWDGGSADIDGCYVHVISNPIEIEKILLSGNTSVSTHTFEQWTFRITLKNYGSGSYFEVKDTIPAEFNVSSVNPSNGTYTLCKPGKGNMNPTKLNWRVYVESGEEEYIDVSVYTRLNPAGKQEFTSPGDYILNEGAEIVGLNVKSNGIMVHAYD